MKKVVLLFASLIFACMLNAQNIEYVAANLNMRTAPNASASVALVLSRGVSVTISGNHIGDWVPVVYNGRTGYVYAKHLTKKRVHNSPRAHKKYAKQSRPGHNGHAEQYRDAEPNRPSRESKPSRQDKPTKQYNKAPGHSKQSHEEQKQHQDR